MAISYIIVHLRRLYQKGHVFSKLWKSKNFHHLNWLYLLKIYLNFLSRYHGLVNLFNGLRKSFCKIKFTNISWIYLSSGSVVETKGFDLADFVSNLLNVDDIRKDRSIIDFLELRSIDLFDSIEIKSHCVIITIMTCF